MYPILVSAVSTVAANVIDNWLHSRASKTAAPAENFAALLEKGAVNRPIAGSGIQTKITALRERLLDSPEVRTLLASADPAKQPTLIVGPGGALTAHTSDGQTKSVTLSAEAAATARELGALTSPQCTPPGTGGQILLPKSVMKTPV